LLPLSMKSARFFVDSELRAGTDLTLPDAVAHHAVRVLRLAAGAPIVLFNGRGGEFAAILRIDGRRAVAAIGAPHAVERESPLAVTLLQAWVATEKLDWIVEKAVELGAVRIVLFGAERSVVRIDGERRERRLAHLRQLAVAACEQCGRNRVPAIAAARDLDDALALTAPESRFVLLPDAAAGLPALAHAAAGAAAPAAMTLLVGPEGGFTPTEAARAQALGCAPAHLGPRVLRTETAGLAALAALQAVSGDLAGPH
jgi:16S rRNA (uracil1498-N3)-methyltransferase